MDIRCERCTAVFNVEKYIPFGKPLICSVCNHQWNLSSENIVPTNHVNHGNDFNGLLEHVQFQLSNIEYSLGGDDLQKTLSTLKNLQDYVYKGYSFISSAVQKNFLQQLTQLINKIIIVLSNNDYTAESRTEHKTKEYKKILGDLERILDNSGKDDKDLDDSGKDDENGKDDKDEESPQSTEIKETSKSTEIKETLSQLVTTLKQAADLLQSYPDKEIIKAWNFLSQAEGMLSLTLKSKDLTPNLRAEFTLTKREVTKIIQLMEAGDFSALPDAHVKLTHRIQTLEKYTVKDIISLVKNKNNLTSAIRPMTPFTSSNSNAKDNWPVKEFSDDDSIKTQNADKIRPIIKAIRNRQLSKFSDTNENLDENIMKIEKKQPIHNVETQNSTGIALRKHDIIDPYNKAHNQETFYMRSTKDDDDLSINSDENVPSFIKRSKGAESSTQFVNKRGDSGKSYFPKDYIDDEENVNDEPENKGNNIGYNSTFNKTYYNKDKGHNRIRIWSTVLGLLIIILLAVLLYVGYQFFTQPSGYSQKNTNTFHTSSSSEKKSSSDNVLIHGVVVSNQNAQFIKSPLGNTLIVKGTIKNNTNQIIKSVILRIRFNNQKNIPIASWTTSLVKTIPPSEESVFSTQRPNIPNVNGSVSIEVEKVS